MKYVQSFRDLDAYKASKELSNHIFKISLQFPKEEKFSLTDQIRRSSRSIGAQIAECWGKRRYEKHFISKLTDADSERYETEHWIETALSCSYIDSATASDLNVKCHNLGSMINGMINKSHLFCR